MQAEARVAGEENRVHPAVQAWEAVGGNPPLVRTVTTLKWEKHGRVYRLVLRGDGDQGIIAKYGWRETLATEAHVYGTMLPALPLASPQMFGLVHEPDGAHAWLLVEEGRGRPYQVNGEVDRCLAAEWIAAVHAAEWSETIRRELPERGPVQYLGHLRSAVARLARGKDNPELGPTERGLIDDARGLLDMLEKRWQALVEIDRLIPPALTHGDFAAQNLRVQRATAGEEIVAFDWEYAGWASPAVDLAQDTVHSASPDLETYWHAVRRFRPALSLRDVQRTASAGAVFRLLASLDWVAEDLVYEGVADPMACVCIYGESLDRQARDLGMIPC